MLKSLEIMVRIDENGKVLIPKDVSIPFNLKEGMPMEILIDEENNMVCFKEYVPNVNKRNTKNS
jgi:AbrB family looped-hinge helix DNA binding protein